jgi:hypothetical protein
VNRYITALTAGLFIGSLLKLADIYGVMPWLLGIILSCMAVNVLARTGEIR